MKFLSQLSCEYSRVFCPPQSPNYLVFSRWHIPPWEISLNAQGTSMILFALFHSTHFNDLILTILYQHIDGYCRKPQSSNTIEVCFLLALNLKQVFCIGGFLLPKRLFKVPGIFSQCVASRLAMPVGIKPVQEPRAGRQHVEGFHRPVRKWYKSLHLCPHGWNSVTGPYLTAKESGKCSLIVCPKEEIGGQLAVSASTSCLGCISLFIGGYK